MPASDLPAPPLRGADRPRCPRCGARLGALEPDVAEAGGDAGLTPAAWYCGCCGLVVGAAPAAAGAAAPASRSDPGR